MFESDEEKIRRIFREEYENIKKEEQKKQEIDKPIPAIKVWNTIIQCDWRTRECKILKSDGTPVSVGGNDDWEGIVEGDTIKSIPRKKSDNDIE